MKQTINMIINIIFLYLISWFFFFCCCFLNITNRVESMSFYQLYELHRKFSSQCFWFVQCKKALQQSTVQTIQQQQQKKEICCLLVAFECRRCFVNFANNTKLHQHIRNRYTKKSKIFIFSLKSSAVFTTIFTSSFSYLCLINHVTRSTSAIIFSSKSSAISTSTHTSSPSYSCLINYVTKSIFTSKFFAVSTTIFILSFLHYFCLINYVTRSIFITSSILYFIVQDLYSMFRQKFKSSSRSAVITRLSFASLFGIFSRQTQIILYFKSKAVLISIRKYAHSRFEDQSTRISHLTVVNLYMSIDLFVNNIINFFINSITNFFDNNFNSFFSFWLHCSLTLDRKCCIIEFQHCCFYEMK